MKNQKDLSRGVIVDIDETVESIRKAVRQAEQKIKHPNQGCYRWNSKQSNFNRTLPRYDCRIK